MSKWRDTVITGLVVINGAAGALIGFRPHEGSVLSNSRSRPRSIVGPDYTCQKLSNQFTLRRPHMPHICPPGGQADGVTEDGVNAHCLT